MKIKLIPILPVVLMLSACASTRPSLKKAGLGGEIVEAEATVPYNANDLPGTKAAALAAAQRAAVEMVVGVYVDAKTRVQKAVAIEHNILTHTQGFVKKYQIISEGPSGPWYKMRIRALVTTDQIHEELDSLGLLRQPSVGNPRAALFVQEWIGERPDTAQHATRAITQELLDKGFHVVELSKSINREDDPVDVAKNLAPGTAELLIAGVARAQALGYDEHKLGGLHSYRANVTLRVLEVGTGEVVTTTSEDASGLEGTPDIAGGKALEKAARSAASDLSGLPEQLSKRSHVAVTVNGLISFEALAKFETALRSEPGVKDVLLRSYVQSAGVAVLDVRTEGLGPQELADACVRLGGPSWSVYQVMGQTVQLNASPAGR